MKFLIIKLGASGDVVRTTFLLNLLIGDIDWITSDLNEVLLKGIPGITNVIKWSKKNLVYGKKYDLVVNLEDTIETSELLNKINYNELFGSYLLKSKQLSYTDNSKEWFDLSLISRFGKQKADELKFKNKKTYQELILNGLMGQKFSGEKYFLPKAISTDLIGDIAISLKAGKVWPMKNWAYFNELKDKLKMVGFKVNFLPQRDSILEHLADIQNHKFLISGDSLPMHLALGSGLKCVTIFICTSPWEIYNYNYQEKIVSPYLEKYFYKRNFDSKAVTSISLDEVFNKTIDFLKSN